MNSEVFIHWGAIPPDPLCRFAPSTFGESLVRDLNLLLFKVGDYVGDCFEFCEGLVRNHNSVLVLDSHEKLENVKGIGPKVFLYK